MIDVLSAGIIVADHVCTPIAHLPAAGELVMADGMLLTIGGCAANAAVDLDAVEHAFRAEGFLDAAHGDLRGGPIHAEVAHLPKNAAVSM